MSENSATHQTALIRNGLAKRPGDHVPFTPTSAYWLTLTACWFALFTARQRRRATFRRTDDLEQAIRNDIATENEHPKPFVWTKTADEILASVTRFC